MIQFTIKTLDSNNHHFSVDDETTVQQLKEKICEQMGIEVGHQRLIFCGRVLQDDKKLSDYGVDGKVVHLVQGPPPSTESRQNAQSPTLDSNADGLNGMHQQVRRLMTLAGPSDAMTEQQQLLNMSPTAGRLELIRRMVTDIRASLVVLRNVEEYFGVPPENNSAGGETSQSTQNEPSAGCSQEQTGSQTDENNEENPEAANRVQNTRRRFIRTVRARHSRPRDFAQLLEELEALEEEFIPYRTSYIRLLRVVNDPNPPSYSDQSREDTQRVLSIVMDIMHGFAHAYHAVSDITLELGPRVARLTSDASATRQPIPMQAHINVIQADRRPQQPPTTGTATSNTNTQPTQISASFSGTVPSASAGNIENNPEGQTGQTAQANQNQASQPDQTNENRGAQLSVNINMHPEPLTYQVEIATRLPTAFPNLTNGLAGGVNFIQPSQQNENSQNDNQTQNQGSQPSQTNRRQMLFDFENLFRNLSQASGVGGVEVVMSMEEIPHVGGNVEGGAAPNAANTANAQSTTGTGDQQNEVYVTQMPWGGPPSADLLQNIVSSVIRQGLVPAVEGVALQAQIPAQLIHDQIHGQQNAQSQETGQTQHDTQANQGQQTEQGAQEQLNQSSQPRQRVHLRRASATTRGHAMPLSTFIYDRFLHCNSHHARRRLQRMRDQYQQQLNAREQIRVQRASARNIENLRERASNISEASMNTLLRLLDNSPTPETWLSALMVAVSRGLFMSEPLQSVAGEPALVPSEFYSLRFLLRDYMHNLLTQSTTSDRDNAFETVADILVNQQAPFINSMGNLAPLREDVNVFASIRTIIRARLPVLVASVMSDSLAETFVSRFYSVFTRLFIDLCLVITYCCQNGVDGLKVIYAAYLAQLIRDFDEPIRVMLVNIGNVNLERIIQNLGQRLGDVRHYIHFNDGGLHHRPQPHAGPSQPQRNAPMSPVLPRIEEQSHSDFTFNSSTQRVSPLNTHVSQSSSNQASFSSYYSNGRGRSNRVLSAADQIRHNLFMPRNTSMSSSTGYATTSTSNEMDVDEPERQADGIATSTPKSNQICDAIDPSITSSSQEVNDDVCSALNNAIFETDTSAIEANMTPVETEEPRVELVSERPDTALGCASACGLPRNNGSRSSPRSPPNLSPPRASQNTPATVSRKMIWSQWTEEFSPQVCSDQQSQTDDSQEPYSDGYLSGMSARKRRCIRQSRPPTDVDGYVAESVGEVVETTVRRDVNTLVRSALREYMRTLAQQRASSSSDYQGSNGYAATRRFVESTRPPTPSSEEPDDETEKK